jgi:hypothetical protein
MTDLNSIVGSSTLVVIPINSVQTVRVFDILFQTRKVSHILEIHIQLMEID